MRRAFVFLLTTSVTAGGILWWLHDGDLIAAIEPIIADWSREGLVTETPPD